MAIGVPYDLFWHLTPKKLESFEKAYKLKREIEDENNRYLGLYFGRAVSVALDTAFNGKNAKSKYFDEPILQTFGKDDGLTQEERDKKELEKMLRYEEQWAINDKMKGLPETKIL